MSRASIGRMIGRGTVLVVDADHSLSKRVREIVEPHGFDVAWATTVHETYAHMNLLGPPRLLLVALGFSNLVGWSLLERIQRDPRMSQQPIALATAYPAILAAHRLAGVAYPMLLTPIVEDRLIHLVDPAAGPPRPMSDGEGLSTSCVDLVNHVCARCCRPTGSGSSPASLRLRRRSCAQWNQSRAARGVSEASPRPLRGAPTS